MLLLLSETEGCDIPINFWLGIYFAMLGFDTWLIELRDRLSASAYWS